MREKRKEGEKIGGREEKRKEGETILEGEKERGKEKGARKRGMKERK